MFSSDITKIKLAELKAKGDGGTIQRLRKCCDDAAAVMEHTAKLVQGEPLKKAYRAKLVRQLLRGSSLLRSTARFSSPAKVEVTEPMVAAARKAIRRVDGVLQVTTDAITAAIEAALAAERKGAK